MESMATEEKVVEALCDCPLVTDDPKNTIRTCEAIWQPYEKTVGQDSSDDGGAIVFDLDPCPRVDPGGLLLLFNAARRDRTRRVMVSSRSSSKTYEVIVDNLEHLTGVLDEARQQDHQNANRFLLRQITDRDEMVGEVAAWAEMVRGGTNAGRQDVALWETQISEIAANTFQHSKAADGVLIAGEAFPQRGYVQLAAIDFGRTIPHCIEPEARRRGKSLKDGDLLAFATEEKVSSHCVVQNQGSGLPSLVQMVKENGGSLQILSRDGYLRVKSKRKYRNKPRQSLGKPILAGTLIVINLKIK